MSHLFSILLLLLLLLLLILFLLLYYYYYYLSTTFYLFVELQGELFLCVHIHINKKKNHVFIKIIRRSSPETVDHFPPNHYISLALNRGKYKALESTERLCLNVQRLIIHGTWEEKRKSKVTGKKLSSRNTLYTNSSKWKWYNMLTAARQHINRSVWSGPFWYRVTSDYRLHRFYNAVQSTRCT